jgi:hypothetical protein
MSSSVAICHAKPTTYIDHLSDFRNYSASDNSSFHANLHIRTYLI